MSSGGGLPPFDRIAMLELFDVHLCPFVHSLRTAWPMDIDDDMVQRAIKDCVMLKQFVDITPVWDADRQRIYEWLFPFVPSE
eukprot:6053530-Pyramimonas_sp.AAC.1